MSPASLSHSPDGDIATRPIALLIQPSLPTVQLVQSALAEYQFDIRIAETLPDHFDSAAFMLIEADRGGTTYALSRLAHRLAPQLPIVDVLNWWNEDEILFAGIASLIVHVPLRDDQVTALRRFAGSVVATADSGAGAKQTASIGSAL